MPNTEDYAIVIGISDYRGFKPLPASEGDALEFAKWLRDPAGGDIPDTQVKVIVTSDRVPVAGKKGMYPWRDDIDDRLAEIIGGRQGHIGRRLYLYFSGHGFMPAYANIALLMANAEIGQLWRNMGATPYRDALANRAHFDELVFILDCCGNFEKAAELGKPGWGNGDVDPNAAKVKTLIALGTEMGHNAYAPDDGLQRSFFTKHLLDGLHGAAAAADGSITASSLRDYVKPRVEQEAWPKRQVPDIPIEPNIVFRQGGQGQPGQRLITFAVPAEWPLSVEVQDGYFRPIRSSNAGDSAFKAALAPGIYQIVYPARTPLREATVQVLRVLPATGGAEVKLVSGKAEYSV